MEELEYALGHDVRGPRAHLQDILAHARLAGVESFLEPGKLVVSKQPRPAQKLMAEWTSRLEKATQLIQDLDHHFL